MIGFLPTPIPAVQTIGGIARNEELYDTELENNANLLGTQILCFNNFNTFLTVPAATPPVKQPGRDTNLSNGGTGGGLPQGVQHFAYAWSCEVHSGEDDLTTFANRFFSEQANRLRRLSFAQLVLNQTSAYMTVRLVDLLAFDDSVLYQSTHGAVTTVSPFVGDRKGKSMTSTQRYASKKGGATKVTTVRNSPYILQAQQPFVVRTQTPANNAADAFTPTNPMWVTHKFWGITVRGIS